jgi:hypothetical protein
VWAAFGNRRPRYAEWSEPDGFGISSPESVLRALTHDDDDLTVDYCAADLDGYADGDTVGTWPARRGGLDLSTVAGTPAYTAPDSTVRVPSVAYAASGERHEGPSTLDWSAYGKATILGVHYTESVSGVSRGMSLAAATTDPATGGGLTTYRVDGKITGLHRTDEPESSGFWFERDSDADAPLAATVITHDLGAASSADLIRIWVNGEEETGTGSGDSSQGSAWQSDLRVRLGAADTSDADGLDGRLARFIACPRALSADQAVHASDLLATITRAH